MNFLAHAYLSFGHSDVLTGNMISDFVKGKTKFDYAADIQKGIMLHRAIDTFTDAHEVTKKAMEIFRPHYRLYSGAIIDVVYDHFLASDKSTFKEDELLHFSQHVYKTLEEKSSQLPLHFTHVLTYMKAENWLWNYRTTEGLEKSLKGLVRRAAYIHESDTAIRLFHQHYNLLQSHYAEFMADVKLFAKQQFDQSMNH
jgi:acyl carrier protein phosphodiesterase